MIQRKVNQIDDDGWLGVADPLTDAEKSLLEIRLAAYESNPDAGCSWQEVEAHIEARLKQVGLA
jgi:putative addiction module component (TIGR02574 family)